MENLTFSLGVTLLGMLVVFAGLLILIGFIRGLGAITSRSGKKKEEAPARNQQPVEEETVPEQPAAEQNGVSPEVIAAITAAIAMVWPENTGFTVRHVRRAGSTSVWSRAAREEQLFNRL